MKKFVLIVMLLCGSAMLAHAEMERVYELYEAADTTKRGCTYYRIDRAAMKFEFDSDSEDEAKMLIKNYKKTSTSETFDLYPELTPTTKAWHVTFKVNAKGKTEMTLQSINPKYTRTTYVVGNDDERDALYGKKKSSGSSNPAEKVVDKAKDKAKGLLNKGKGLLKK